jgi:hypothetical protein
VTDLDRHPRGPEEHKAAARSLGLPNVRKLLVLAPGNDPYYKGTAAHRRDGEWFAALWERFGYSTGIHLRRAHYQVLSTGCTTSNGEPYENTEKCWAFLCGAAASARLLGLVDVEAFVDRRNPAPIINRYPRSEPPVPAWSWWEQWSPEWALPALDTGELNTIDRYSLWMPQWQVDWPDRPTIPQRPRISVSGYDYNPDDQPAVLEVWVEKSTMQDILGPLCEANRVNLVTGVGNQSITATVRLLRRAERHGKAAHVLYISDFDPAGEHMPTAVARQAQFWREQLDIHVPLTLDPLVLTREQVERYTLPRVPIKESDRRAAGFEARNGTGAVELDALEALHPGELATLIRTAIRPYVDRSLSSALARAENTAAQAVNDQWDRDTNPVRAALVSLEAEVEQIRQRYESRLAELWAELRDVRQPFRVRLDELGAELREAQAPIRAQLDALADEYEVEMAQPRERLEWLASEARQVAETFDPELPERPEPAAPEVDRGGLLYDSARSWRDQLQAYRTTKGETA